MIDKLLHAGFDAYLVGGGVRDLVAGKKPKDFDVVTDAKPEQIRRLFRNCRLIGRRFRLAHVHFRREIIEVATFRAGHENASDKLGQVREGLIIRDNVFGSMSDDAIRRDFAINALYYDIRDQAVVDYTGGFNDLKNHRLHIIGDATKRYKEDPVRMLRAIRFACKLNLKIEQSSAEPIKYLADLLRQIPESRLFDEIIKLFFSGHAYDTWQLLLEYQLLPYLLPLSLQALQNPEHEKFIHIALKNTDHRITQKKSINPAFLLSVFLWPQVSELSHEYRHDDIPPAAAMDQAIYDTFKQQAETVCIQRRYSTVIQEIWQLQARFHRRHGKKPFVLLNNRRFRIAYDFLELRAEIDPKLAPLTKWWDTFYHGNQHTREILISQVPKPKRNHKKKK